MQSTYHSVSGSSRTLQSFQRKALLISPWTPYPGFSGQTRTPSSPHWRTKPRGACAPSCLFYNSVFTWGTKQIVRILCVNCGENMLLYKLPTTSVCRNMLVCLCARVGAEDGSEVKWHLNRTVMAMKTPPNPLFSLCILNSVYVTFLVAKIN